MGSGTLLDGTNARSSLPCLGAKSDQRFRCVLALQCIVILIRQLPGGAIELDLLQGPQRYGPRREIVVGIEALVRPRLTRRLLTWLGTQDGSEDEVHRARHEQDAGEELEQRSQAER